MQKLIFNAPLNSLSLGQVSYNMLLELKKRDLDIVYFPIGQADLSAYDPSSEFVSWLQYSANNRLKSFDRSIPTLKVWHINGAESRISDKQFLYTFYECDCPTDSELNILRHQQKTFFSSSYAAKSFSYFGAKDTSFIPLGFDESFKISSRRALPANTMHWILIGKWEVRKNTDLIIRTWIKKYGNIPDHQLSLCVTNPFFNNDQNNQLFNSVFGGKKPFNVNVFGTLKKNTEIASVHNAADFDLSGFSGAEGWGLPAFTSACMGKWPIVTNCSSHTDWANGSNSILVEPKGKRPCYDGVFFTQGGPFNQGNFFDFDADQLNAAMSMTESKFKTVNHEGLGLKEKFTYAKTVDKILSEIF